MPPARHAEFVARAVAELPADERILAIAVTGSWARGLMDEYSDVDLILAAAPEDQLGVVADVARLAGALGPLLSCFPGDHLSQPRLLICLYGPPRLHVDFDVQPLPVAATRVAKSAVLWERDGALTRAVRDDVSAKPPGLDLQWIEDRMWVWLHYAGTKVARGELFEALDALSFVRGRVLGPLLLTVHGQPPHGVRRVEAIAGDDLPALRATHAPYDARACVAALFETAELYRRLRARYATPGLVPRAEAEAAVIAWLSALAPSPST
jgi:predicted nucleotidyltransferase